MLLVVTLFPKAKTVARRPNGGQARRLCYNRAPPKRGEGRTGAVPAETTPPPCFPQNPLSPGDERTARRMRLTLYGCALLLLLAVVAAIVGAVHLVRSPL